MKLWSGQIGEAVAGADRWHRGLLAAAISLTVLLSVAIASLAWFRHTAWLDARPMDLRIVPVFAVLVLLLDLCTIYNQLHIRAIRRWIAEREELFRLISENAADMIAVVDSKGRRVYNSPAYQKILGYTADELKDTSPFEQIHPADRPKVIAAAAKAQRTQGGQTVEYRMRHKDGSWRVLESTASTALNNRGEVEKLIIVNRDVTERRQLQQNYCRRKRWRQWDVFPAASRTTSITCWASLSATPTFWESRSRIAPPFAGTSTRS